MECVPFKTVLYRAFIDSASGNAWLWVCGVFFLSIIGSSTAGGLSIKVDSLVGSSGDESLADALPWEPFDCVKGLLRLTMCCNTSLLFNGPDFCLSIKCSGENVSNMPSVNGEGQLAR